MLLERFVVNSHFRYGIDVSHLQLDDARDKVVKDLSQREFEVVEDGKTLGTNQLADLNPTFHLDNSIKQMYYAQKSPIYG